MATPSVAELIKMYAPKYQIDPLAAMSVARTEGGLNWGAIGDAGTSFGPFQLHVGGALPKGRDAAWANSPAGVEYALRSMSRAGAKGLKGRAAIAAIVKYFERPADIPGQTAKAIKLLEGAKPGEFGPRAPYGSTDVPGGPIGSLKPSPRMTKPETRIIKKGPSLQDLNKISRQFGFKSFSHAFGLDDDGAMMDLIRDRLAENTKVVRVASLPVVDTTNRTKNPPISDRVLGLAGKYMETKTTTTPIEARVVEQSKDFLGTPYVYGGKTPSSGFDCSGFIQWLYGQQGIKIPGYTIAQFRTGKDIPKSQIRPGDAVFFRWGTHPETGEEGPLHEGLYIGEGKFIQAPKTGDVIKISNFFDRTDFVGARRYV